MSAPPLVDPPTVTMPTMVSRLPKFGSRPRSQTAPAAATNTTAASSAASARLTNGFYHHPGPAGVNGTVTAPPSAVRQNGFIRVPSSFSMKWRKEGGATEDGEAKSVPQQQQGSPQAKKAVTPPAGKGRGFGQPATSSSPSPQLSPRTLPVSKSGSRLSPPASGLPKRTLNGVSKPCGALRQPQSFGRPGGSRPSSGPGSRSGSPLQKKSASRSYSSDSLGSAPSVQLTENDRFRSRSLTQVRRQPSPTPTPSPPSSSPPVTRGNRAPSAQAPPRKPEGGARGGGGAKGRSGVSSLPPPAALKKPLLPNLGPASKPSGISYRLSRPSLMKQPRPLRVTPTNERGGEINRGLSGRRDSVETPSTTDNSPVENSPDVPEPGGLSAEPASQGEVSIVGETLEDMSLSSTSSLDRNDTSQEYMDDFDNLGNGGVGILLLSSKNDEDDSGLDRSCSRFNDDKLAAVNGVAKATGLCFLDDGLDWNEVGERGDNRLSRLSRRRRSSHPEYHEQGGSSLDLSPSDSCGSGGTYMWDEEGLEPLGGAATTNASIHTNSNTTHHIGSFDSDLNSIDILNNLDCDLGDDDLMLDVDFPEDASLHGDAGDVLPHMAQWRRRQLCWGTQDVHNDNESDFQCFKLTEDPGNKRKDSTRDGDLILDLCPTRTSCLSPGSPSLGLDVEELAEDCSAVRSQLEYLQRLLLQEEDLDEDTLTTDTLSPETIDSSHSSDSQVQALLQEVQQLREDLRSRDRTIAQLTMQLTVPTVTTRCRCQETTGRVDRHTQTSVMERESVASQTPWRDHAAFPPFPFLSPPWQYQRSRPYRRPKPSIPSHLARKRVEKLVLYFSDTACHRYFTPPIRKTRNH